jgi:hypothetical protein
MPLDLAFFKSDEECGCIRVRMMKRHKCRDPMLFCGQSSALLNNLFPAVDFVFGGGRNFLDDALLADEFFDVVEF